MIDKQRKVKIFLFSVLTAIIVSLFMPMDFYEKFLNFLGIIAIGFFTGNGIEHIAGKFRGGSND